jgi:hypothetical protein
MPDITDEKAVATTYPPESLYNSWRDHADTLDLAISQYIIRMVEAGRKQVDLQETTSDTLRELRQQHTDLQRELEHQRTRNQELERQLHHTAHAEIISYVSENPGVAAPQIIQHIADTVPGRVAGYLDVLEGEELRINQGEYYPVESPTSESEE